MTDTLTVGFFWLLIGVIAAAMFGVMLARSWRRAGNLHDPLRAATVCEVRGHQWEPYSHGRTCVVCWEVHLDRVFDQELHPDEDLGQWDREVES